MTTKTVLTIILSLSATIAFAYSFTTLAAGFRKDAKRKYFALFSGVIAAWLLAQGPTVLITEVRFASLINYLAQTIVNLLAACFVIFISSFFENRRLARRVSFITLIMLPFAQIMLFIFNPVDQVQLDSSGFLNYTFNTVLYPLTLAYAVFVALLVLVIGLRFDKTTSRQLKRQKSDLFIASAFFVIFLFFNSYIIPYYFVDNIIAEYLILSLASLLYITYLGRQVLVNKMIDLRRYGARAVIRWGILLSTIILVVILGSYAIHNFGPTKYQDHFLFGLFEDLVVISAVAGTYFTIDKVLKKAFRNYEIDAIAINNQVQELRSELDIEQLGSNFSTIVLNNFKVDSIAISIRDDKRSINHMFYATYDKRNSTESRVLKQGEKYEAIKVAVSKLEGLKGRKSGPTQIWDREELKRLHVPSSYIAFSLVSFSIKAHVFVDERIDGEELSDQEIGLLSGIINDLALVSQNAMQFEEIKKFNITLQQKIDDATRQLRRTNEKLKALDETKDEFISMASHQLRTPLTSVKGYVSMVLEGDVGKITKQQRALLDQAFLSSQRMVYLIADLLNVSRLRTGKFIIEAKPTQLADVIEGEIQQLEEAAKSKNMTLTYHRPKDFPMLNLDETKIRQVIMNFADNALYYTPAGGKIDIYLVDKGQSIEFSVVDNGIGVPVREQHHLFTKFYRANNAQKARPDGTGLGLFMAKKVVVAQGGAIIFRSEEGKGSTFGFSFPKKVLLEAGASK